MKKLINSIKGKSLEMAVRTRRILMDKRGEGFVDTAIKILIAVVIGALLLAGLYALFGEMIMPELRDRIQDMFNYGG
ncbi:MAG TPA: DUF6133 family protein [Spirochaetales bacterium]|jgi:hypothetical protein|uniref:DUF6133 family protein n=1 Tax=Desulfitibacter alkalitolerans TaxID=264641 RepID=UPI000483E426|nr:DUF6133 family protein [Desulfitibacter alkalitolerans]HAE62698.1 hypothetical protein [Eubacteriaceae bacterium]HOT58598.1 DUF6133 family protein [Spirochaetales bacterium]HQK34892.1 DUF6133 family protein [Spirochaetales bacterium]